MLQLSHLFHLLCILIILLVILPDECYCHIKKCKISTAFDLDTNILETELNDMSYSLLYDIIDAITHHHHDVFDALISSPDVVKIINGTNASESFLPLYTAIAHSNIHAIKGLIEKSTVDIINKKNRDGHFPINIAEKYGRSEIKEYLISKGAKQHDINLNDINHSLDTIVNFDNSDITNQLNNAVINGYFHKVDNLLRFRDMDINKSNSDGITALHYACMYSNYEIAKLLLKNGANSDIKDKKGRTPLIELLSAVSDDDQSVIDLTKLLIEYKANVKEISNSQTVIHIISRNSQSINLLLLLLQNGANPRVLSTSNESPLHFISQFKSKSENLSKFIKILIDNGADIDTPNSTASTPLHMAVNAGHVDLVKILLKFGANRYAKDIKKQTALSLVDGLKGRVRDDMLDIFNDIASSEDEERDL